MYWLGALHCAASFGRTRRPKADDGKLSKWSAEFKIKKEIVTCTPEIQAHAGAYSPDVITQEQI
jgi:hypothetical protein